MKQYVLDEPMAAAPLPQGGPQPASLTPPGWWRWFLLALLLEPLALAILYVALNGSPNASAAAPSHGVAYVASFSFPQPAEDAAPAQPHGAEAPVSRIRLERGRYLVELHDEAPAAALAMLAQATRARVTGGGVFVGSSLRLTRSVVATSPREAWQAVFGDVANFAIACAGNVCEVRFVSLAMPGAPVPGPESLQGEFSHTAPATAPTFAAPPQAPVDQAAAAAAPLQNSDGLPLEN